MSQTDNSPLNADTYHTFVSDDLPREHCRICGRTRRHLLHNRPDTTVTVDLDLGLVEDTDDHMLPDSKAEAKRLLGEGKYILLSITVNRASRRVQFLWEKVS